MMSRAVQLKKLDALEAKLNVSRPPRAYIRWRDDAGELVWADGKGPPASGPRPEDVILTVVYVDPLPREEPRP